MEAKRFREPMHARNLFLEFGAAPDALLTRVPQNNMFGERIAEWVPEGSKWVAKTKNEAIRMPRVNKLEPNGSPNDSSGFPKVILADR